MPDLRNTLRLVTVLVLVSGCGEIEPAGIYVRPSGPVALVAATDAVGLRVGRSFLGVERITDVTLVGEALPTYYTAEGFGPLVADERIRARFPAHLDAQAVATLVRELGGVAAEVARVEQNLYDIHAASPEDTVRLAEALQPHALWAHPDFFQPVSRTIIPNDTYLHEQWHHSIIRTPTAWNATQGDTAVSIAVIDTGLDMTHPDLASKVVAPYDAFDDDPDPTPDADAPHGTACAGLAAAVTDNSTGVAGVCPDCSLMPIRMGSNELTRSSALSSAFYWAIDHGARVISNSWTTELSSDLQSAMEFAANEAFDGRGAVLFFASGNDGVAIPASGPAAHSDVVTVGATNPFDVRAAYSNIGPELDITAPAGSMTTDLQGTNGYAAGDYTDDFNGTSAAAPVAAGVAGLLLSIDPDLPSRQVATVLRATAAHVDSAAVPYVDGRNDDYGYGRIDATAAVAMMQSGFGKGCDEASACGPGSTCLAPVGGIGGNGLCTLGCQADDACPLDMTCRALDSGGGSCFPRCTTNHDCPAGSACWPDAEGESGHCMAACKFDSHCASETCNSLGLCGALQPPGQTSFEPLVGHTDFSCRAGGGATWLAALAAGLLFARRR